MINSNIEKDNYNISFPNSKIKRIFFQKKNFEDNQIEKNIEKNNSMDIDDKTIDKNKNLEEIPQRYKMYKNNELINVLIIKKIPLYDYEKYIVICILYKVFIIK